MCLWPPGFQVWPQWLLAVPFLSGQDVSLGRLAFFLDGRRCSCLPVGVGHSTRQPGGSWVVLLFPRVLKDTHSQREGPGAHCTCFLSMYFFHNPCPHFSMEGNRKRSAMPPHAMKYHSSGAASVADIWVGWGKLVPSHPISGDLGESIMSKTQLILEVCILVPV